MDQLIERALAEARARGEFDNLPGMGRPIELSTLSADVFAKTLAESGAVHPIAFMGRRIKDLRERLAETADPETRQAIQMEAADIQTREAVEIEKLRRFG